MSVCLLCDQTLESSIGWQDLIGIKKTINLCNDCSKQFERADIIEEGETIDKITSLYTYNEAMREYLHQYKFLQDIALAHVFAQDLKSVLIQKEAIIVPIPMHPAKKIERTFAHVDELLKAANIPFAHLLEKVSTEVMGEKSKEERLAMKPLFKIKPGIELNNQHYILIDDIYTTGTTLNQAAALLKEAGAKKVEAVTLIRAETMNQ